MTLAAIGLIRPKNALNAGGVLRAADCYGAALVAIQGARYKVFGTDTTKAYRHIPTLSVDDIFDAMPFGAVPVAIEFIETATPLPAYKHPKQAFYIFGPEDGSIPAKILTRCRDVVYVPTAHCMNLAATVNVVLYDRLLKESK